MRFKKLLSIALLSGCTLTSLSTQALAEDAVTTKDALTEYTLAGITFSAPSDWIQTDLGQDTWQFKTNTDQSDALFSIFSMSDLSSDGFSIDGSFYHNSMKSGILNQSGLTVVDQFPEYRINDFSIDRFYFTQNNTDGMGVFLYDDDLLVYCNFLHLSDYNWETARIFEKIISSIKPINNAANNSEEDTTASADNAQNNLPQSISATELEQLLLQQPMYVLRTEYIIQDDTYKALYPDMLSAVIYNNSQSNIKNAHVAFVAWDANNFPIKIVGEYDYNDGYYIQEVDFGDVNMIPGSTFGENMGMTLDHNDQKPIATFKAIVIQYTDFDGNIWDNPYYETWRNLYEDKMLPAE